MSRVPDVIVITPHIADLAQQSVVYLKTNLFHKVKVKKTESISTGKEHKSLQNLDSDEEKLPPIKPFKTWRTAALDYEFPPTWKEAGFVSKSVIPSRYISPYLNLQTNLIHHNQSGGGTTGNTIREGNIIQQRNRLWHNSSDNKWKMATCDNRGCCSFVLIGSIPIPLIASTIPSPVPSHLFVQVRGNESRKHVVSEIRLPFFQLTLWTLNTKCTSSNKQYNLCIIHETGSK